MYNSSTQCVCIYTAVYSQTLTAISIFKYVNIVCIIQVQIEYNSSSHRCSVCKRGHHRLPCHQKAQTCLYGSIFLPLRIYVFQMDFIIFPLFSCSHYFPQPSSQPTSAAGSGHRPHSHTCVRVAASSSTTRLTSAMAASSKTTLLATLAALALTAQVRTTTTLSASARAAAQLSPPCCSAAPLRRCSRERE